MTYAAFASAYARANVGDRIDSVSSFNPQAAPIKGDACPSLTMIVVTSSVPAPTRSPSRTIKKSYKRRSPPRARRLDKALLAEPIADDRSLSTEYELVFKLEL